MKSKVTTYMLIAVVIAVWGVIVWKLFFQTTSDKTSIVATSTQTKQQVDEVDTLRLDYRDPFLGKSKPIPIKTTIKYTVKPKPVAEKTPIKHDLKYFGRILKDGADNCLVEINRQQYQLKKGDIEHGYKLTKIYEDSLLFTKDGDVCCVKIAN